MQKSKVCTCTFKLYKYVHTKFNKLLIFLKNFVQFYKMHGSIRSYHKLAISDVFCVIDIFPIRYGFLM